MFARTVASSGSPRHFKFVQDTEDMMVKVYLTLSLFKLSVFGAINVVTYTLTQT